MGPILIVDDEFGVVEALRDLLADEGYRTVVASNGRQALERMEAERPALVLLDHMMPVMNGPALLAKMLSIPHLSDVPVVMMSASPFPLWRHLPCAAHLPKPFGITEVLELVHRFVGPPGVH
jgi:CheY-like chemotaxis protein